MSETPQGNIVSTEILAERVLPASDAAMGKYLSHDEIQAVAALLRHKMSISDEAATLVGCIRKLTVALSAAESAMFKGVALHRGETENPADYCKCDSCSWLNDWLQHRAREALATGKSAEGEA